MTPEAAAFQRRIFSDVDRIVKVLQGADRASANRKILDSANSLVGIANHTLSSLESFVLGRIAGRQVVVDREADLGGEADPADVVRRAQEVKERVVAALEDLAAAALDEQRTWQRAGAPTVTTVRDLLVLVVAHTAEHAGHAELTRDLVAGRSAI